MAILWMVLVALVVACEGHPGQIRDFDDEFYSEVRHLLSRHAIRQGPANAHGHPEEVVGWPRPLPHLGQVTGVAVNSRGQPVIFHRGPRVWDASCFNASNHFQHAAEGPIAVTTVLTLDPASGAVVSDWGSNLFYMPHGITLDAEDNIWVTDVALHQVLKVVPHGLALIESLDLLCIADRENMRVVCPRAGLLLSRGAQPVSIQTPDLGRVYGVAAAGGLVYAVNGPTSPQIPVRGFTLDPRLETALDRWGPTASKYHYCFRDSAIRMALLSARTVRQCTSRKSVPIRCGSSLSSGMMTSNESDGHSCILTSYSEAEPNIPDIP
ncbi:hypothetical protein Cfor_03029 [Coptotermes formosanus]|uniref:peptidylamidoglycolate lyase n=1 Tax=Coptotermes formosanus TaxID=36987 RepID=A0A6L2P936_COPFO|nr:hypothetical protein Cfor_03029 [Coptotermes formosanus]